MEREKMMMEREMQAGMCVSTCEKEENGEKRKPFRGNPGPGFPFHLLPLTAVLSLLHNMCMHKGTFSLLLEQEC